MLHLASLLVLALQSPASQPPTTPAARLWWGDFNADGLPDVLAQPPGAAARLFENLGLGDFEDVGARYGLPELRDLTQVVWHDVDADGDLDLLAVGPERLVLLTQQDARFSSVGAAYGLDGRSGVTHAHFLDLDGDARADLWLSEQGRETLLRLSSAGRFEAVTLAGLEPGDTAPVVPVARVEPRGEDATPRTTPADADGRREAGARAGSGRAAADASSSAPVGVSVGGVTRTPGLPAFSCVPRLADQSVPGCLEASSLPTLGRLYPLSNELNVDPTGRVGMGTIAPTHRLTVNAAGSDDVLRLIGAQSGVGFGARLNFGDADFVHLWEYADDRLEIKGDKEVLLTALGTPGEVNVASKVLNVTAASTRFLGGRVGIGLVPAWPLDVLAAQAVAKLTSSNSTNGSVIELRNQTASPGSIGAINFVNAAGQFNGQVAYTGTDALTLRAGGTERMRILAGGNVGIATTLPQRTLDIVGSARANVGNSSTAALHGETSSTSGTAVIGQASATAAGPAWGVHGRSTAPGGEGVHGEASATTGSSHGVFGSTASRNGFGVFGYNSAQPLSGPPVVNAVYGEVDTPLGQGVWGRNFSGGNIGGVVAVGVLGTATGSSQTFGVFAEGKLGATGTKTFVQPIPGDPSRMLQFVCLEGNEAGTYCRGQGALHGGLARIPIPEDFRLGTSSEGLTVQVTARGPARVWVAELTLDELIVRGEADVAFDWTVNGVRRAFEDVETITANSVFVPRVRGVPYMQNWSEEYRRLLVEAGITNADGTPNEETAAALGWELLDASDPRAALWLPPEQRPQVEKPAPAVELDAR